MNTIKSKVRNFIKKWLFNHRSLLFLLIALSFIIIIVPFYYWDWFAQIDESGIPLTSNSEIIRNTALIIAGIWAFYGIMLAERRTKLQERGQVAERFARAAEQLDSKSDSVRMVAILALQKVANEADEKTFQDVVKTLCSYVRENRPIKESSEDFQDTSSEFPAYLQQIIDFLSEIDDTKRFDENNNPKIDLSATDLRGAPRVYGKNLSNFNLSKANLKRVNLQGAILKEADLSGVSLEGAVLMGADLKEAKLLEANLKGANLRGANLKGADLWRANLEGANLRDANLKRVVLSKANIERADLEGAKLEGANLSGADLKEADLWGADLERVYLRRANLEKVYLGEVNFTNANTTNIKGLETAKNIESVKNPTPEIIAEIKRREQQESN